MTSQLHVCTEAEGLEGSGSQSPTKYLQGWGLGLLGYADSSEVITALWDTQGL